MFSGRRVLRRNSTATSIATTVADSVATTVVDPESSTDSEMGRGKAWGEDRLKVLRDAVANETSVNDVAKAHPTWHVPQIKKLMSRLSAGEALRKSGSGRKRSYTEEQVQKVFELADANPHAGPAQAVSSAGLQSKHVARRIMRG